MADPRAFISFDYDNNQPQQMYFVGQIKNSRTPFNVQDWSNKEHLNQRQWETLTEGKIGACNMLIVLVGKSMFSAVGVEKEIAMAHRQNVPVFGVYVDDAGELHSLPTGLRRDRTIPWKWDAIASAIDQVMTEGKNK